jgi:hypothetical protein
MGGREESELVVPESAIKFAAQLVSKRTLHVQGKAFGLRFLRTDVSKDGSVAFVFAKWELQLWKEERDGAIATCYDADQLPPNMNFGEAMSALRKQAAKARAKSKSAASS